MSSPLTIRVEITGQHRSGIAAKSQKPYCMFDGYVHLPNNPYPDKASFYATSVAEVPQAGMYECDVVLSVKDGRMSVEVDPRQGRRMSQQPKPAAVAAAG